MKRTQSLAWVGILALGSFTQSCSTNTKPNSAVDSNTVSDATRVSPVTTFETSVPDQTTAGQSNETSSITISEFAYDPDVVTIKRGASVSWTNKDKATHTATNSTGDTFDSKDLETGESYAMTFKRPGSYTYRCSIHNYMTGTVVVK